MKISMVLFALLVSGSAFAAQNKVDCSKASEGTVIVDVKGDRLDLNKVAEYAYSCLLAANQDVKKAREVAIQKSKADGNESVCGKTDKSYPVETITVGSWIGERPYPTHDGKMSVGGSADILVHEPFVCIGLGSGVFSGINAAVSAVLNLEENYIFSEGDDNANTSQHVVVKLQKIVEL